MKKRRNFFYDSFVTQMDFGVRAMELLKEGLLNFENVNLLELKDKVHEEEHSADEYKHTLEERLAREFVTPIDREDIFVLYDAIDDLIDAVDEVSYKFYLRNYQSLPKNIELFIEKASEAVSALREVFVNFNYIDDKKIMDPLIKKVTDLEEEVDKLFEDNVHEQYLNNPNDVQMNHYYEKIYNLFEYITDKCRDVCKHVSVIMYKNL